MSLGTHELPEGWSLKKFGDLLDFKGGSQPPKSEFITKPRNGYVRLLQIRDFESDDHAVYIKNSDRWPKCEADDIMVGRYGASIGKVLSGKAGAYNVALVRMVYDRALIEPQWVRKYLLSDFFQKPIRLLSRSAQNGFNKDEVADFDFPLPPISEQRRIIAQIEALQARCRKAREALEAIPSLLEQFRQSVLAAAFRGDLTADWREQRPEVEPADVLLERIRAERRRKWEQTELAKFKTKGKVPKDDSWKEKYVEPEPVNNSDLPELPEGWCWAAAEEVVAPDSEIVYGIVQPGPQLTEGIPYVRGCDIQDGVIQVDQLLRTSKEIAQRYERASLRGGDVLLGIIRATKVAIVPKSIDGANITQGTARFRPSSAITTDFLAGWLDTPYAQGWLHDHYRGIDMPGLNLKDVRRLPVPLAPRIEQVTVASRLQKWKNSFLNLRESVDFASSQTMQLDQSTLAKAFRGELVPQDPNDEPASVLLERLRAERSDDTNGKPPRGRRKQMQ